MTTDDWLGGIKDDDLRDALTHPDLSERRAALKRVVLSAWNRGWTECDEEYKAAIAMAGLAVTLPQGRGS